MVMRYKKGRPSSGPLREESLEQLFNVDALNTEGAFNEVDKYIGSS